MCSPFDLAYMLIRFTENALFERGEYFQGVAAHGGGSHRE